VLAAMYRIVHDDPPRLTELGWPAGLLETTMALDPGDRWPMSRVSEYLRTPATEAEPAPGQASATTVLPVVAAESTLSIPAVGPASVPVDDQPVDTAPDDGDDVPPAYDDVADEDPPRRGAGRPVLVGLALLLVAGLVAWALLHDRHPSTAADKPAGGGTHTTAPTHQPSPKKSDRPSPTSSATSSPTDSATSSQDGSGGGGTSSQSGSTTADRMGSFVEDYIATALSDPATAWQELTPKFQDHVGSYGNYAGYWNTIESAPIRDVRADPDNMTVSYIITWDPKGPRGKEDESVVLELVKQGDRYLIDRER